MKKIPNMFLYDENMKLTDKPNPVCQWVFDGEGRATRKYDGTSCMFKDGVFYKRRMVRPNKKEPVGFIMEDVVKETGKKFGWVPVGVDDKWHVEAGLLLSDWFYPDGTYELVGPKVQGNPEKYNRHILIKHSDAEVLAGVPRTRELLIQYLASKDIEGIVFHHEDGRMAKIRKKDFGLKR